MSDKGLFRRGILKTVSGVATVSSIIGRSSAQSQQSPFAATDDNKLRVGNKHLELTFRRDNGGLETFTANEFSGNLLADAEIPALSWGLRFYHPEYNNLRTASYLANQPRIETQQNESVAAATLTWSNPTLKAPPNGRLEDSFDGSIEVTVTVRADEPVSRWGVSVTNNGNRAIRQVICPQVTNIAPLATDGSDALYIPSRLGRRYQDPTALPFSPVHRYPSGYGTMQFVAYLDEGQGLYAAAEDTGGYAKRLEFVPRNGTLGYRAAHLVPYEPGADVRRPYAMTIGIHTGGWRAACDRYRSWVTSDGWLSDTESLVPDRLRRRGISYHERSYARESAGGSGADQLSFETIQAMISNIQDRLGVPMGFRWWGWEEHGRPAGGDWLPPYEGRETFERVISALDDINVDTIAMLGPTFLLESSDYWTNLEEPERLPLKSRDGSIRRYSEDGADITLDRVSPLVQPWKDHYFGVINELVAAGVQHIDVDGVPWQWVPNCWDSNHNHPPGKGGNWFPQRIRSQLRMLHQQHDVDDGLALGGEGIADFYLPYMTQHNIRDGMAEFDDPAVKRGAAEVVPMFPYTFNDYAVTRSQKGHIGTFAEQRNIQRLIGGRALEWGAIPLVMGHYDPAPGGYDEALLEYYERIGSARAGYANRFVSRGQMLAQPIINRRSVTIRQRGVETSTAEIRGTGWRSPGGDLGIVLTNVTNREQSRQLTFELNDQPFELPADPLVYIVKNGTYRLSEGTAVSLALDPSDVALIAAIPGSSTAREALAQIVDAQTSDTIDREGLETAKRAFDSHEYERARTAAAAVTDTEDAPESTTTQPTEDTPESTDTQTPDETTSSQSTSETPTSNSVPGFGIVPGGAVLGGTALARWLSSAKKTRESGKEEDETHR